MRLIGLCLGVSVFAACSGEQTSTAAPAAAQTAAAVHPGKAIYDQACFSCHAVGLSGAPKLGDSEAWAPRAAKGMDLLLKSTKEGMGGMPPMAACFSCTDDDFINAINYMIGE